MPHLFYSKVLDMTICAGFAIKTPVSDALSWIYLLTNAVIPFTIILVFNLRIINQVHLRSRRLALRTVSLGGLQDVESMNSAMSDGCAFENHESSTSSRERMTSSRDAQLTVTLLLVTMALLVLALPLYVHYVTFMFLDRYQTPLSLARFSFSYNFTNNLYYTSSAINFFLYCLSGSKFRQDLKNMLGECFSRATRYDNSVADQELSPPNGLGSVVTVSRRDGS